MKKQFTKQVKKQLLVIICMLAAGICYSCGAPGLTSEEQGPELILEAEMQGLEEAGTQRAGTQPGPTPESELGAERESELETESEPESEEIPRVYVHVCGAVVRPGVYELAEGSRVFQAVELAGGLQEEAAGEYLNMAQVVKDGMQIAVPSQEEAAAGVWPGKADASGGEGQSAENSMVNLNTAGKDQLMTLKGIGEARAEDILRYREEHGTFRKIEDIMKVPGIKDAAFEKIKDRITV